MIYADPAIEAALFERARGFLDGAYQRYRILKDTNDRDVFHIYSRLDKRRWLPPLSYDAIMVDIATWLDRHGLPASRHDARDVLSKVRALIVTATPDELALEAAWLESQKMDADTAT